MSDDVVEAMALGIANVRRAVFNLPPVEFLTTVDPTMREQLRTEARAALAAAGYVIEQDWQPIETAPRDGTRFIAWWQPCAQVPDGRWHECKWTGGGWYHPFFTEPTHWKPPPVDGLHLAAAKETQA